MNMIGDAKLTDELMNTLDEHPRRMGTGMFTTVQLGEMAVIRLLGDREEPLAAGEISTRLKMTTSRIAAVLNSLEKKRLLIREADPSDRRRVLVSLTKEGRAFCKKKREEGRIRAMRFLERLGEEDAETFVRLLKKMFTVMPENEN